MSVKDVPWQTRLLTRGIGGQSTYTPPRHASACNLLAYHDGSELSPTHLAMIKEGKLLLSLVRFKEFLPLLKKERAAKKKGESE